MTKLQLFYKVIILFIPVLILGACTTNKATGEQQFTAFMPASSEAKIGAEEHDKILKQYGGPIKDQKLQNYVESIGNKMVPHTEREDVKYTFTLLDSPVMNAFALPGGYVYITRGILTHANDEAELASVIGHEIGHVTARHSAERMSKSVLAGIGGAALSIALGSSAANQAFGVGADLYLKSHSRSDESEADKLGIRYIEKAGYDTEGSVRFLTTMGRSSAFEKKQVGKENVKDVPSYFRTHPLSETRVADAKNIIHAHEKTPQKNDGQTNKVKYMQMINGMIYGDAPDQGYITDGYFIHPEIGFKLPIPKNYYTQNNPDKFIAASRTKNGPILIMSSAKKDKGQSLYDYVQQTLKKQGLESTLPIIPTTKNDLNTIQTKQEVKSKNLTVHTNYIEWDNNTVFIITIQIPNLTPMTEERNLIAASQNFSRLSPSEKSRYTPKKIQIRAAKSGDSVENIASKMPFDDGFNIDRFRVINGLSATEKLRTGQLYKTIAN